MAYTKHEQDAPQPDPLYIAACAAALQAFLIVNPKMSAAKAAALANNYAEEVVFQKNRREQINNFGYTNLY